MEAEEEKETGAMAVVSRADEDSSGLAAWWRWRRQQRRRWRGGVYRGLVERGGREGEVKKDTKARRKSLNDKRSGQLGLGRQGPKGAAG